MYMYLYINIPSQWNYAISYCCEILQYEKHQLSQITLLVNGIKSYSM